MKRFLATAIPIIALMACPAYAGQTSLVWDNFPVTEGFPLGYDTSIRSTSERDTQHSMGLTAASWAVDDFHVLSAPAYDDGARGDLPPGGEVVLTQIEWIGVREVFDRPDFGYDRLDYAIFTRTFDPGSNTYDFQPLQYGNGQQALFLDQQQGTDWQIDEELGQLDDTNFVYRGSVSVPNIPLDPETDYWVGVRLVGNSANPTGGTAGRSFIVSGSGNPESVDGAFRHDPPRGGGDDWQPIQDPITGFRPEMAYRLTMNVVPEPATMVLLALSGLFIVRCRRA